LLPSVTVQPWLASGAPAAHQPHDRYRGGVDRPDLPDRRGQEAPEDILYASYLVDYATAAIA
jgi:hypothetical protein